MNNEDLEKQFKNLADKVDALGTKFSQLENKVNRLESKEKTATQPLGLSQNPPAQPIASSVTAKPDFSPYKKSRDEQSLEKSLGIRWMVIVGVIAVLIALVYEVRVAIEKGWITEEVRCAAGVVLGIILIAAGYVVRGKYRRYGEILMSGGVVSMLIGIYCAHYMFNLIGSKQTIFFISTVAIGGAFIGWKTYSKAPLYIGALGCYLAPLLIKAFGTSALNFFIYLAVLNISYLILSVGIRLLTLNILCLYSATIVYSFVWFSTFNEDPSQWLNAFSYQAVQALSFGLATLLPSLIRKTKLSDVEVWVIFPALLLFYFFGSQLLIKNAESFHLIFAISTVIFIILLSQIGRISLKIRLKEHSPSLMATVFLIIVSAHLIYHNLQNISLSWGAIILLYFALTAWFYFKKPIVLLLLVIALGWIVAILINFKFGYSKTSEVMPFLNAQFPAFLIFVTSFFYLAGKMVQDFSSDNQNMFIFFGHVFALRALQIEVSRMTFAGNYLTFFVTMFWVIYAATILIIGMTKNSQFIRTQALAIFGLCTLKVFLYDTLSSPIAVKAASYFALGVVLILAGYFYQRYRRKNKSDI